MESTLHHQFKARVLADEGGSLEVPLGRHRARVDVVTDDGELIEVQAAALGALRSKLRRLLRSGHRVRVIKPVVLAKRIVKKARPHGPEQSVRKSPIRGSLVEVFDEFVGLAAIFPTPGLVVQVVGVTVDEVRVARRRRPGYSVIDRRLREVHESVVLSEAADLWRLLPDDLAQPFTTLDLAAALARPIDFAQRVAYCLRLSGAATPVGKAGNRLIYLRPSPPTRAPATRSLG